MLMDVEYQDDVLLALIDECEAEEAFPNIDVLGWLCHRTTYKSPARKLLVDWFVYEAGADWRKNTSFAEEFPVEFVNQVVRALLDERSVPIRESPWEVSTAKYMVGSRKEESAGSEEEIEE